MPPVLDPDDQIPLFDFKPEKCPQVELKSLQHRIWTDNKARLVERYLNYFLYITRHGTYIDGFAGPQYPDQPDSWAARAVVELRPRWLRHFYLCERDPDGVAQLEAMVAAQPPRDVDKKEPVRSIEILPGDFNRRVGDVLNSGVIGPKEATFCLLDQRTFECEWQTVVRLAEHKTSGSKIELFYFLATKWLHRALSAQHDTSIIEKWWGRPDWASLAQASTFSIGELVTRRFKEELGYVHVHPWPIFESAEGGAIMYYMVHASDHAEAPQLMRRAYEKALKGPETLEQLKIDFESGNW